MNELAVIFDMDGVLVDNTPYHVKAWEVFCKKNNIKWDMDVYLRNINGRRIQEGISSLFSEQISPKKIHELALEKEELYREIYKDEIMPVKGLLPFLEHLTSNNIPIAIATSANELNVQFTLEGINISRYFNTILDDRSINVGKPDPEIYLKTAKKLNMAPAQCVVFEDSISGVKAALNAGMKVVGLTTTHPPEKLTDVHLIKDNFEGITINTLQSLFI